MGVVVVVVGSFICHTQLRVFAQEERFKQAQITAVSRQWLNVISVALRTYRCGPV
jgi:hypothetical protein